MDDLTISERLRLIAEDARNAAGIRAGVSQPYVLRLIENLADVVAEVERRWETENGDSARGEA